MRYILSYWIIDIFWIYTSFPSPALNLFLRAGTHAGEELIVRFAGEDCIFGHPGTRHFVLSLGAVIAIFSGIMYFQLEVLPESV